MITLALDTSTLTASVALLDEDNGDYRVLASAAQVANRHSDTLLASIDRCCAESGVSRRQIDLVAVGAGPGSFTGLRIGLATAKGLGFALERPIVLVSSLAALAMRAGAGAAPIIALTDAHKSEVYIGRFRQSSSGLPQPLSDEFEAVLPPAVIVEELTALGKQGDFYVVGDGLAKYPELAVNGSILVDDQPPRAEEIARLGVAQLHASGPSSLGDSRPHYIRLSEPELVKLRREKGL